MEEETRCIQTSLNQQQHLFWIMAAKAYVDTVQRWSSVEVHVHCSIAGLGLG